MNPLIYNILHIIGALTVFLSFGLLIGRALLDTHNVKLRKLGGLLSGIGLFLLLLGGFGMIARYQYNYLDLWLLIKLACWVTLGALTYFINKKPLLGMAWFWLTLVIGILATSLGIGHRLF
jgi:hypothetical protein